jgi:hypothetical protein
MRVDTFVSTRLVVSARATGQQVVDPYSNYPRPERYRETPSYS